MRAVRGFTIVEFAIAIAVAGLLGAAAISRYNGYLRQQEFTSGGQQLANCLSRASQQAQAGGDVAPPRFTRATISYDSSIPRIDCRIEAHSQYRADGTEITTTQLLQGNPAETASGQPLRGDNLQLHSGTVVRVVFGSLERGVPLGLSENGIAARQPDNPLLPSYVPFGRGFSMDATTNAVRINSSTASSCGVLAMPATGTPVRFQQLSSCP